MYHDAGNPPPYFVDCLWGQVSSLITTSVKRQVTLFDKEKKKKKDVGEICDSNKKSNQI